MKIRKHLISLFLTIFVIGLIVLSGPASAVTVELTQPNNANKGSDVSFSISVDINDPDIYLPIKYGNVIFTGPNGYSKTCKVNMDGTSDCSDVDFTITNNAASGYGYGYGYDSKIGYGYDFGYGYGSSNGQIKIDAVWHTPSDLTDGTYNVKADIHTEGSANHDFSSSEKSFSINTASTGGAAPSTVYSGGGGGASPITETVAPIVAPVITTPTTPTETAETGGAETENTGTGPTGAAVGGGESNGVIYSIVSGIVNIFAAIFKGIGSFFSWIF